MRIIEQMTPCRCADCNGQGQLTRMELMADTPADIQTLTDIAARIKTAAHAAGQTVTERHISVNIIPRDPSKGEN